MKPLIVVLGATYEHARQFVLANPSAVPADARLVSASCRPSVVDSMNIHRVIEAPGADRGRYYPAVHFTLTHNTKHTRPLT